MWAPSTSASVSKMILPYLCESVHAVDCVFHGLSADVGAVDVCICQQNDLAVPDIGYFIV